MSFLWLVAHDVWSKKVRSLLTSLAVAIGVLTVVTLGIVTDSLRTTAASVLEVGTADFTVVQRGLDDILQSALTQQQLTRVQEAPGVAKAIGVLLDTHTLDEEHPLVVGIGIRPEDLKPFGVTMSAGQVFDATADDQVLVGSRLADDLGIQVGDTMDVADSTKTVVGIFTTGNVFGDAALMFPLVPYQAFERQPDGLSMFFVQTDPGASITTVEKAVEATSPLLVGIRNVVEFGRENQSFRLISAGDRAATIVAIGIGAIIVMNSMLLSLLERYREFGVLRAIGWSRRRLVSLVAGEAAIIGLVGAMLGVGLAVAAAELLAQLPQLKGILSPTYEAWVFGRGLLTATALTLLGALYPAIRAGRLTPLEALRRE